MSVKKTSCVLTKKRRNERRSARKGQRDRKRETENTLRAHLDTSVSEGEELREKNPYLGL